METVPFELAGMTEICGAVAGVRVVGVSDWVGMRVPSGTTTGDVEALDCDVVLLACGAAELACVGVVLACGTVVVVCDAVGFSDAGMSATGIGVLACGTDVVVCDAVGFSDTGLSTTGTGVLACDAVVFSAAEVSAIGTGVLACDMTMPMLWVVSRRLEKVCVGEDADISVRKCVCECPPAGISLLVSCAGRMTLNGNGVDVSVKESLKLKSVICFVEDCERGRHSLLINPPSSPDTVVWREGANVSICDRIKQHAARRIYNLAFPSPKDDRC